MRGFIAAVTVLALVVGGTTVSALYVRRVTGNAEAMVKNAQDSEDLERTADYLEKEKALLCLMAKESHINKLIKEARTAAALWEDAPARKAAKNALLAELNALCHSFGLNPL